MLDHWGGEVTVVVVRQKHRSTKAQSTETTDVDTRLYSFPFASLLVTRLCFISHWARFL